MAEEQTSEEYFARLVDEDALKSYLDAELGAADTFDVEYHPEGHSNETLFVTHGDQRLVVRRPPPGETAETAHDVLREYRVVDALQRTDIPLPETVLACEDHDVMGSDFYVMVALDGDVMRDDECDRFASPAARRAIGDELVDTLATIHRVDYEAAGLGEFGRPEGFTQRQVDRWTSQLDWAFEGTGREDELAEAVRVGDWLAENVPDEHEHTLVHGDYKLDNVMLAPGTSPEIVGVFDWELSALGDPLTDLGWMLAFWYDEGDPAPAVPELMPRFLAREGYPTRRELVERYEERAGIDFDHQRFYRAFGVYKLVAVCEMFYRRYLEGNSDDPLYATMDEGVPRLVDHAVRIVDGDQPL